MNPLWKLYAEWKRLTENEGNAILNGNWAEVCRCQGEKEKLQSAILQVTQEANQKCPTTRARDSLAFQIREQVNELIALETANSSRLNQRIQSASEERLAFEQQITSLSKLRKSYSAPAAPLWSGYS